LLNFGEGKYPVTPEAAAKVNVPVGVGVDGQGAGAVGYLVGQAGQGLACMFHMMNEARIGVGMAATMLGMAGYHASLDYAHTRIQGRPIGVGGKKRILFKTHACCWRC
jgi:butyryl-CoA dehydrogenase